MGLGWSLVIPQLRINPQSRRCHLQEVGPMRLVGSEYGVLRVLDEVKALRGERPQYVWTSGRCISRDKAVSHHQLACVVVSTVPDTTTSLEAGIAIDGAKDHLYLCTGSSVEDTATGPLSPIIGNRAVDQHERPALVGDAATGVSQIT